MRAMTVFPERREFRVTEVPRPELAGEHDVMVKIREVGICGTDREICEFSYGSAPAGRERFVLGHEALGEVVDVAKGVHSVKPGDLVAITVRRPCDAASCVACRMSRQDFCTTGQFHERGIKEADGFMTELVVEDERYLVQVPRVLADVGVLVEPLSVASKAAVQLDAILQRYPWEPTHMRALVLGAGPIGLLGAMMMMARHTETCVYSLEPKDSDRAQLVRSFGADYVSARDVDLPALASHTGAFDIIFEAVGPSKVAFTSITALAPNGIVVLSGVPGGNKPVETDLDNIMRRIVLNNQVIFGTVNASRGAFEAAVRHLEQFMTLFPAAVRNLITDRVPLEGAAELLRRSGGIKQVVELAT